MSRLLFGILILIAMSFIVSACRGDASDETAEVQNEEEMRMDDEQMKDEHMEDEHMEDEHMEDNSQMDHMHVEPPAEFADISNPFSGDSSAISAGKVIFETNCLTCHGAGGAGDGPGSVGLEPKPSNLADGMMMADMSDGYLFWRVTKGGALDPFNSAMVAWESLLSVEQRWQVISYVRTLSGE